jgi:hypothetical protein
MRAEEDFEDVDDFVKEVEAITVASYLVQPC